MDKNLHNELRKEFQLERLILFSDAVFAIAITLLAIDIKVPEIHPPELTEGKLLHELGALIPKFTGFLVSFILIGQYWTVHHRLFGFVINFTPRLVGMNLFFLLAIALMPFSTAFYSEYLPFGILTPIIFYTANISALGVINFCMWQYISNPRRHLSENLPPKLARYFSLRALTVPVIFIIFSFVYTYRPAIAVWIPTSIPLIMKLIFRPMKKRLVQTKS